LSYTEFILKLFPIYNELRANTQQRMNIIIGSAIGGATLTYEVIAVFGYLTFGDKVHHYFVYNHMNANKDLGWSEYHPNVPSHVALHSLRTSGHYHPCPVLICTSSDAMQELLRQGV
jgi:hypothetical protein